MATAAINANIMIGKSSGILVWTHATITKMTTILALVGVALGLWLTHWFVRIIRGDE